jgi:SHS2 domain-containing protein
LYRFQGEHRVLINAEIHSLSPQHLDATLKTIAFDPDRHEIECDIKAVTYHQIEVSRRGERWVARIIFDL